MRSTSALVLVGALMLSGCAGDPQDAIEEGEPGLEETFVPPPVQTPEDLDETVSD